jgi:hypothetical protein
MSERIRRTSLNHDCGMECSQLMSLTTPGLVLVAL